MAWHGGKRNGRGAAVFEPESSAVFTSAGGGLQREKHVHATKSRAGELKRGTQEPKRREASLHSAKRVKSGGREAGYAGTGRQRRGGYRFFVFLSLDSNAFQLQNLAGV
jgi:hypothetical protein